MEHVQSVSLVIPCYRESNRVGPFLTDLAIALAQTPDVDILVVDDGSEKDEVARMEELVANARQQHPAFRELLALPENIGKGGAVYEGWDHSRDSDWLMFVDADGAVPASEVRRLIDHARCQVSTETSYFGSRIKMLGRRVERLFSRHLIGRIYATMVSELLNVPVYDTQCGCKMVLGESYRSVREQLSVNGFAFDVDLMMALLRSGTRIEEFPLDWREMPGGKIRLLRDSYRMFQDILKMRAKWIN